MTTEHWIYRIGTDDKPLAEQLCADQPQTNRAISLVYEALEAHFPGRCTINKYIAGSGQEPAIVKIKFSFTENLGHCTTTVLWLMFRAAINSGDITKVKSCAASLWNADGTPHRSFQQGQKNKKYLIVFWRRFIHPAEFPGVNDLTHMALYEMVPRPPVMKPVVVDPRHYIRALPEKSGESSSRRNTSEP